jgi:hypothetical protein
MDSSTVEKDQIIAAARMFSFMLRNVNTAEAAKLPSFSHAAQKQTNSGTLARWYWLLFSMASVPKLRSYKSFQVRLALRPRWIRRFRHTDCLPAAGQNFIERTRLQLVVIVVYV